MAFRVRDGLEPAFGGVAVADRVAERVSLAREVAEGVIGVEKQGAGSGLAPRALVIIWVFCQNTQYRPLCSHGEDDSSRLGAYSCVLSEHKEPSPVFKADN